MAQNNHDKDKQVRDSQVMGGRKIGEVTFVVRALAEGEEPPKGKCIFCGEQEVVIKDGKPTCMVCLRSPTPEDMLKLYKKSVGTQ